MLFIPVSCPPPTHSQHKTAGKKMGAKKSPAFMFLPPCFCLSLCVGPVVPGSRLYPWNPRHPWSYFFTFFLAFPRNSGNMECVRRLRACSLKGPRLPDKANGEWAAKELGCQKK
jgi:hypothetical protein